MSFIDDIRLYFNKKEQPGIYFVVFLDNEGTMEVKRFELTNVRAKDAEILKQRNVKKVIKKIDLNGLAERVQKMKLNKKFLLNFLSMMEKGGITDTKTWKVTYMIAETIEKIMYQDLDYFEFYLYISQELKKARWFSEILGEFKIFKEYIEFIKAVESLPDEERPKVFSLLKEKIYKTDEITKGIISPAIQPTVMLVIALWIIVGFSQGIYPPLLSTFFTEGREDLIPWLVSVLYAIWEMFTQKIVLIGISFSTIATLVAWMFHFESVKDIFIRQLLQVKLYRLYNEFFLWYVMKLYGSTNKTFIETIRDLKHTYSTQLYYFVIFEMIEWYLMKGTKNIPLGKYSYIFTPPFINIFTLMIKSSDLKLIENYLLTAEEDIKKEVNIMAQTLSMIGMIAVSWIVMMLMLSFQMITSAMQSLYSTND